ncbi:arginase-1-like [Physella acuta]|uniref:arginase-1-like n=1 Tax=Physella acuta TaxID=109671 RepID=UPI0027DD1603|nr:arginase-1-like [Physella acuta]
MMILRRSTNRLPIKPPTVSHVTKAITSGAAMAARDLALKRLQLQIQGHDPSKKVPRVGILGAPLVHGQPLNGTKSAPELLRRARINEKLEKKGVIVHDFGDLKFTVESDDGEIIPGCKFAKTVGKANHQIAKSVERVLKSGCQVLLLGGDHSIALGSVFGHTRVAEEIALVWVDAHPDINTPLTSLSGNIHGMPVGFLCKELPHVSPPVPGLEWLKPCISAKNIAYIGVRSIDPGEKKFLNELNICAYSVEDIQELGMDFVIQTALHQIDPMGVLPIHVSFDVDVLDPELMPATGTPVERGLSIEQARTLATAIFHTGRLALLEVVELNPMLVSTAVSNWCADVAVDIILRCLRGKRRQAATQLKTLPQDNLLVHCMRED